MRNFFNVMLGVALLSTAALAQVDEWQVRYAANLGAGTSVVNVANQNPDQHAICANVYVYAEDEQLIACCSCPLTPNAIATLSVQNDLISNTLTPGVPTAVTIALEASDNVGGNPAACNAAALPKPVSGMRAWGTTLHAAPGGGLDVTETAFSFVDQGTPLPPAAFVPSAEESQAQAFCAFIVANGSHFGICKSCQPGAQGAKKQ